MRLNLRRGIVLGFAVALALLPAPTILAVVGPVAPDDAYQTDEDTPLVVLVPDGVLANDSPSQDTCVASTDTSALTGSLTMETTGAFTYTPPADYHGETSFTYKTAEGGCPTSSGTPATVTITVNAVNDAPTATADSFIVLKDRTLNVGVPGVLINDHDVDGDTLTAIKVTNPAHGVVVLAADGSFSYTPTAGYVGLDAFVYKASDGSLASPNRVVSLNVTAPPPSPTPKPTPSPTPEPTDTPEPTLEPSPSTEPSPSIEPSPTVEVTLAPSVAPSVTPAPSPLPVPASGQGGLSLPVLLVILLFVLLVGFGAALYVPKWLAAQRGEPLDDDSP